MRIIWSRAAENDIIRLGEFVAAFDSDQAVALENMLFDCPSRLKQFPRRGRPLPDFAPREVREYGLGRYLMRYEVQGDALIVLRFFHGREDR